MSNDSSQSLDSPASEAVMARLLELENRTGYRMQQCNGQRKYWNPNWNGPPPNRGSEVFVGKIPRDLFEDELVPVFEKVGQIYELRLMMDFSGYNRGYAFVTYTTKEDAVRAIELLDNYEIRSGMKIGVCRSVDNCRLFVGSIPKDKSQDEIRQAMCEVTEDVNDVIVYPGTNPGEKNRGFAFVEYSSHRAAAMARRKLIPGRITLFGYEVAVDWADPESDVNDDMMNRVKNVYVRNLKATTSEFTVWAAFNNIRPGSIEKVKKIEDRDFAFVHFHKREDALYAMQMMNGQLIDGQEVHVSLAKPNAMTKQSLANKTCNATQMPIAFGANKFNGGESTFNSNGMTGRPCSYAPMSQSCNMLGPGFSNYSMNSNDMGPMCTLRGFQNRQRSATPSFNPPNLHRVPTPTQQLFGQNALGSKAAPPQPIGRRLRPANTMDHIASIKCPVTLLSELCTRLNLNCGHPQYFLFLDEQGGTSAMPDLRSFRPATRYVYQVQFAGSTYTPPISSDTVEGAKRMAAQYVLDQIAPWLKLKLDPLVRKTSSGAVQSAGNNPSLSSSRQPSMSYIPSLGAGGQSNAELGRTMTPMDSADTTSFDVPTTSSFISGLGASLPSSTADYSPYYRYLTSLTGQSSSAPMGGISMQQ